MRKHLFRFGSLILAGLGAVWSTGCLLVGIMVTWNSTGYDSWDILCYLGFSTLGFAFFALGVLVAVLSLIMRRFSSQPTAAQPVWAGLLLNILLAGTLLFFLSRA